MPPQPLRHRNGVAAVPPDPQAPAGRLWRVTDRATFEAFRQGRRVRCGPLTMVFLPPSQGAPPVPRVAFAIGRPVGGAVVRNRIRRRLRAALGAASAEGHVPPGSYLLGGSAALASLPWLELRSRVDQALGRATEVRS